MTDSPHSKSDRVLSEGIVRRPRIYAILGKARTLPTSSGDRINERRFLRSLSRFADVYYNGHLIDPTLDDFGIPDTPVKVPSFDFDLYYVRNNREIFDAVPHPKVAMAMPYDEEVFREADAIIVTTATWQDMLKRFSPEFPPRSWVEPWYGTSIVAPKKVIDIGQAADPTFDYKPNDPKTFRYRCMFGYGFTVGCFGRIDDQTMPVPFLDALPLLRKKIPDISVVFSGNVRIDLPSSIRTVPRIDHADMPYAMSACDAVLNYCDDTGNWLGSGKVIDALCIGVPVLLPRWKSAEERLGRDYPFYFEDADDIISKLGRLAHDPQWRSELRSSMVERARYYHPDAVATRLEPLIRGLIDSTGDAQT